jgi:hypothetical protein
MQSAGKRGTHEHGLSTDTGEAAILVRVFGADRGELTPEAAQYFLAKDFPAKDRERLDTLAEKARQGALTAAEREELDHYCHVGDLLALMKSKARLARKQPQP